MTTRKIKRKYKKKDLWSETQVARYMDWNMRFLHRYRRLGTDALELRLGDIVLTADLTGEEGVDMSTAANALGLSRQTARGMIGKWMTAGYYTLERSGRSAYIRLTPKRRVEAVKRARGMIDMMFECIDDVTSVE
jgi:hypothetical protein